jgi:transposase InsO family protein
MGGKLQREQVADFAGIFDWINWYNKTRRHSSIEYLSPIQFEQGAMTQAA